MSIAVAVAAHTIRYYLKFEPTCIVDLPNYFLGIHG